MPVIGARPVSGRYSGAADRFAIELRIDVDGPRPTRRISADYYRDGRYFGSMRVDAPSIVFDPATVTIRGRGSFSWDCPSPTVGVTIPRTRAEERPRRATLSHFTPAGSIATSYTCEYDSPSFRRVMLQEARERQVTPFESYDTASLPCTGPRRELTLQSAYAEAGIELVSPESVDIVDTEDAGADATWSDAELQAAMQQYFGQQDGRPQWAIWLLHAWSHDDPWLYGLMFDRQGLHRQGCAVFYKPISGEDAVTRREQLHTCVHELGHGFNLTHSWQRSRVRPPLPERPASVSWMNYPMRYPGGPAAFWPQFPFQFDELELAHLRHGFEEDVIMGGAPFGGGSAYGAAAADDDAGPRPDRANTTLRMRIGAPAAFGVGVPVTIAIELAATTAQSQLVPRVLGPRAGNVDVTIRRPDGAQMRFEPLLVHCHGDDSGRLSAHDRPLRDYAYLHYGKGGFAFERPGRYAVQARHIASDGSTVTSNVLSLEVRPPMTGEDREISRLVTGNDDLGTLLSLSGSAAPFFDGANRTLEEVIDRYPANDVAAIARVVRATSLARPFKIVTPRDQQLRVLPADVPRAAQLISPVLDLPAIYGGMSAGLDASSQQRAVAATLVSVGSRRGMSTTVGSFVNCRRREIAGVITNPEMATQQSSAPTRRQQAFDLPPNRRFRPTTTGESTTQSPATGA